MKTLFIFPAAVFVASSAFAARPMSLDDLLMAVRVSDPQLSPDGRWVAYVRTTTDRASLERNSDIWVVAADGSAAPKLLVGGDKSENTPRWTPDGKIAFISSRAGDSQVFIADADGGNIRQLTKAAGGVQPPLVFSPDGKTFAFVADVKMAPDPSVAVHHMTRLFYRHWDEWRENVRHHIFVAPIAGSAGGGEIAAKDLTPGDYDSPPTQAEDAAMTFTPDSRNVVFVSNREGNDREAWTTNSDVWMVPVVGGTAKKLTEANPAADAQPVFSRDGRSMFVRAQRRAGFESDRWYLERYDTSTWTRRTLFESPDLSVNDFKVAADGNAVAFIATNHGEDNLFRFALDGGGASGQPQQITKGGSVSAFDFGSNVAIVLKSSLTSPSEIFRLTRETMDNPQPLTHENESWLKDVTFEKPERASAPGAGGTPIQYWILKPPGFDPAKKYPVVFLIHGGPQGAWDDAWSYRWNPALWAAQGWVIVAPNPRGSFGFGQTFVDEISQDWGGRVMTDLNAVFDAAVKLPYVDPAKQGIAGASYGGYAVDWLITHTNRFKVAVSHDGVFNLESMALATEEEWFVDWEFGGPPTSAKAREQYAKFSPHRFAENIKTPTLVITNELDFRVPVDQGLQLFMALRRNGVPAKALVFPDEGHWVLKAKNSERWHEEVFAWMKQYLK